MPDLSSLSSSAMGGAVVAESLHRHAIEWFSSVRVMERRRPDEEVAGGCANVPFVIPSSDFVADPDQDLASVALE